MERMEEFVCKVWEGRWRVIPHDVLPEWLKDNDFLLHGHRPPCLLSGPVLRAFSEYTPRQATSGHISWVVCSSCAWASFICFAPTSPLWPPAGKGGLWIILPGGHSLPFFLMAVPHSLLPLRRGLQDLLQTGLLWYCSSDYGKFCSLALLLLLL